MFALGIRYLNGWAMATHPADRNRAEWPPHPDRVFMALVAAYCETGRSEEERRALEWLEALPPPSLSAKEANRRTIVTSYVPVNDTTTSKLGVIQRISSLSKTRDAGLALLPEHRSRQARQFPVALPDADDFDTAVRGMPYAYLIWSEIEIPALHRHAMESLCRKATSVGHSASLVQMWVEPSPPEASLIPSENLTVRYRLRVTADGRLGQLEERYKAGLRPVSSLWQGYCERPGEASEVSPPSSHFDANLLILRRMVGPQLSLESTLQLTGAVRETVMSKCPVQPPPVWVSGHNADGSRAEQPHLAFIPLSHVGHAHAEGHLLGVAIAVPRDVPTVEQEHCLGETLFGEDGLPRDLEIRMGRVGVWKVALEDGEDPRVALQQDTWTGSPQGARRWATVTPIVFDRHPKKPDDAEETIAASCQRIGLPRPKDVILAPVSMFIGSPHARRYPLMQRKTGGNLHHTHAIVTFDGPVVGPVLLGAGRYRGYGLCRPLSSGGES